MQTSRSERKLRVAKCETTTNRFDGGKSEQQQKCMARNILTLAMYAVLYCFDSLCVDVYFQILISCAGSECVFCVYFLRRSGYIPQPWFCSTDFHRTRGRSLRGAKNQRYSWRSCVSFQFRKSQQQQQKIRSNITPTTDNNQICACAIVFMYPL